MSFISRWLTLSEAQEEALNAIIEQYADECQRLEATRRPEIQRLADLGGAELGLGNTPNAVQACKTFDAARVNYATEIEKLDTRTLASIQDMLAEEQVPLLKHLQQWRQRRRCLMTDWDLQHAAIDLEQVVWPFVKDNGELLGVIRPELAEYADLVTSNFVRADQAAIRRSTEGVEILADSSIAPDQKGVVMRQRFEQSVRLEMRIGEINRRIAQRIVEKLPEDPADAIQAVLRHRMTPKTYPDLPVCEGYVRHLLAIGVLTADQRAKLETSWTDHERVLAKVNEEMARLEVEWNERLWLQRSMDGQTDYAEEMRRLRAERWDLHQAYLQTILRDFEAAMPDNLKAVIRGSINDIDVLEFRGKNDAYPMR